MNSCEYQNNKLKLSSAKNKIKLKLSVTYGLINISTLHLQTHIIPNRIAGFTNVTMNLSIGTTNKS